MHQQAEQLFNGWLGMFGTADRAITWTAAEQTLHRWLDDYTCLTGTIDAQGINLGDQPFFADWKTIGAGRARNMDQVKAEWRFDPQALTYGVLMKDCSTFTVRWAIKDRVPRYDFEWYTYSKAETDWWCDELLSIASEIRRLRSEYRDHWPVNPTNCTRYGWAYRCPFYDHGCPKLNFSFDPGLPPREHHLQDEKLLMPNYSPEYVFLSSSSVELWLGCHEKYRRTYEGKGISESSEALTIGTDFHKLVAQHIENLIGKNG